MTTADSLVQKHKAASAPPHLLSEIAVLKGQSSDKDKAIARFFDFPPRAVAEQLTLLEFNVRGLMLHSRTSIGH